MKLDKGAKVQPRPSKSKRSALEIRYDQKGVQHILQVYESKREYLTENEAECAATGAGTNATRCLWRKKAREGVQPYYEVFSKIDELEERLALTNVPQLFKEIRERDPYKAFGLIHPRLKYRREDEARKIAIDASHAAVVHQLVKGIDERFKKALDGATYVKVIEEMYGYLDEFEGDLTTAETVRDVETEHEVGG